MGWCTELFCNIHFNKKTYNSLYDVERDIEECKDLMKVCVDKLRAFVIMTEPQKMLNCKDCEGFDVDPIDIITTEFNRLIEEYNEYQYDLFKLEYLKDNWEYCHNKEGLAINPPKDISWDTAYLDGDFVKTVEHPEQ